MTELSKYIGADVDVPAGDIGTGGREIGFMFDSIRESVDHSKVFLQVRGLHMVDHLLVQKLQDMVYYT